MGLSLTPSLSPDAAKTDHVRVIIGIRAACKEREGGERTTPRFDSSQVQFHTDREGWNPKLREERARARAVEWNDGSRRHAEDALILADK